MVLGLPTPYESERFIAATVSDPLAFGGGFGFFGKEAAREPDVHALTRKLHGGARHAGGGGRKGDALFAGGREYGNGDVEQQDRPARMGEKRGELATRFAGGAGNKRDKFAVKAGFANQETRRNGNADPAVLQNIDGDAGAAGGEFGIDAQVVVNACERGFYGRRLRVAFDGIGPGMKSPVFVNRQNNPARRMSSGLPKGAGGRKK